MRLGDVFPVVIVRSHPSFPMKWDKSKQHLMKECGVADPKIHHAAIAPLPPSPCGSLSLLDLIMLRTVESDAADHVEMIRRASYEYPDEPFILFLQDTARFDILRMTPDIMSAIRQVLNRPGTDILLLGHMPYFPMMSAYTSPGIIRCFSRNLLSHAYAMTRPGIQKILSIARIDRPFGRMIQEARMITYAVHPVISFPYRDPPLFVRFKEMTPLGSALTFAGVNDAMVEISLVVPVALCILSITLMVLSIRHIRRRFRKRINVIR